jgi:hypothetical protein
MQRTLRFAAIFLIGAVPARSMYAQHNPTLGHAEYAKWETLGAGALSPDGKWVALSRG